MYNCTINNSEAEYVDINISVNGGVDVLGNTQTDVYVFAAVFSADTISPSVSGVEVVPSYFNGSAYYINSYNLTVSAEASDSLGLDSSTCAYSFNGTSGPWENESLSYNGTHCIFTNVAYSGPDNENIAVYAEDNFGNSDMDSSGLFIIDDDTPNTTALGNGGAYTFGEWTQSNVSVSLTCADDLSGCAEIYYCQDSADVCVPGSVYSDPIDITSEGTYYIRYYSEDNIGNEESVLSAEVKIDKYPVAIGLISTGLDNFVCGGGVNGNVTVLINATDNVGVTYVAIDTSQINGSEGLINLTYNATSGLWETTFYLDDTSMYNFDSVEVTVLADDDAGRGVESWGNETPNFDLVLYDFAGPEMPDETCERQTALTTNFCEILDFEHVNLINEVESNGSENCHNGQELPWGDDFHKVVTLNFTSVNFSDPSVGSRLANLQDALVAYITPPGEYGNSYIFVNASAFSELDTNATITLYGLPFTELPEITTDGDGSALNVQTVINSPYLIEETCQDICEDWEAEDYNNESECIDDCEPEDEFTMAVPNMDLTFTATSFSQYDMEDTEDPTVEITEPSYGYSNGESIPVEFTANGTGTQLSSIYLYINGNAEYNWSYTGIFEECVNETPDMDVMTCSYELFDYTEGDINISVVAFDFGGNEPGNSGEDSMLVTIDQTAPSTVHDLAEGSWYNADFDITLTPTDTASGVDFTNYSVGGIVWNTGTTVSITDEGPSSVYFYSVDNVGNAENVTNITALLDKTNPDTNHSDVTAGWHQGLEITLTSEDELSGVGTTYYSFEAEPEVWLEGDTVNMTESGTFDLFFYSEDNAGNEEDADNVTGIQIDLTDPETEILGDEGNYTFNEWNTTTPTILLNSTDLHSGVDVTLYCVDEYNNCTPETEYNGTFVVDGNGTNFIRYMAVDNVNNEETIQIAKVLILSENEVYLNETMDLNETDYVVVPEDYNASTISVPEGMNATLDVVALLDMDTMNATLDDNITVISNTSLGIVTVSFPAGLVISGEDSWTGEIELPVIMPEDSAEVDPDEGKTATVSGVIEIGFGDALLTFDTGVRINISGEAGKDVGYYRDSTFTKIDTECDGDNQTVGDALPAGGDCRIDVGSDLIVWTKHFTMFVTYTQEDVEDDDDNNGNGGSTSQSCGAWGPCIDGIQYKTCQGAATPYTVTRACEGGEITAEEPSTTSEEQETEQATGETGSNEESGSHETGETSESSSDSEPESGSAKAKGLSQSFIATAIIALILVAAAVILLSGKKKKN